MKEAVRGVRIDKWLWAARFFKTRGLASKACELGRVLWNGQAAKPAREVRVGDRLAITTDGGLFTVDVFELSDTRGPAAAAQGLYVEGEESRQARAKLIEERKTMSLFERLPEAKPMGRDRRQLRKLRGRG